MIWKPSAVSIYMARTVRRAEGNSVILASQSIQSHVPFLERVGGTVVKQELVIE